jgi:isopenicillin-N epimerase
MKNATTPSLTRPSPTPALSCPQPAVITKLTLKEPRQNIAAHMKIDAARRLDGPTAAHQPINSRRLISVRSKPSEFRRHWGLAPGKVFLNHGSFGACPLAILEKQNELRHRMEAEPVQFLWRRYEEFLEPSRRAVAAFVGVRPSDLVFVTNATTGVNAVLRSIRLRSGDEILTTTQDYNACRNVLVDAAARSRAKVVVAAIPFPVRSPEEVLEAISAAVTRRTRLAMIDHVTSSTALVFPISRIINELEAKGIRTLIDGAHAPGMVPLNISELKPSFYTANLHKWVCAPKGVGFLWAREDQQKGLQPAVVSHGNNTPRPCYPAFQDRFDWAGTFDPTPWFCAGEAIEWMEQLVPGGWPSIRKLNHDLVAQARSILCRRLQVESPCPESMLGSMATVPLPDSFQGVPRSGKIDPEQSQLYDEFGVEVPFFRHGQPERRFLRISAQLYNSIGEYDYLASAVLALR